VAEAGAVCDHIAEQPIEINKTIEKAMRMEAPGCRALLGRAGADTCP
jgi:hypothetical protein